MTKFDNEIILTDAGDVTKWIKENIPRTAKRGETKELKGRAVSVSMNNDGTIKTLNIDLELTSAEKALLIAQFPELEGKDV